MYRIKYFYTGANEDDSGWRLTGLMGIDRAEEIVGSGQLDQAEIVLDGQSGITI